MGAAGACCAQREIEGGGQRVDFNIEQIIV